MDTIELQGNIDLIKLPENIKELIIKSLQKYSLTTPLVTEKENCSVLIAILQQLSV